MTSKNNPATAVSDLTLSPAANSPSSSKPLPPSRPLSTQQYLYFTETNTDRILDNLDGLRDLVFRARPIWKATTNSTTTRNSPRCA